jgi:hypothetical protein
MEGAASQEAALFFDPPSTVVAACDQPVEGESSAATYRRTWD